MPLPFEPRLQPLTFFSARRSPPPPRTHPLQIRVAIVGKNEIYRWENLVGPFGTQTFVSQTPPPPL